MFRNDNFGSQEAEIERMGPMVIGELSHYHISLVFEGTLEEFYMFDDFSEAMEKYQQLVDEMALAIYENQWHNYIIEINLYDSVANENKEYYIFDRERIDYMPGHIST